MTPRFTPTLLGCVLALCVGFTAHASDFRAETKEALALVKTDPVAGAAALADISDRGGPRATERLAFYTLRGIGRSANTEEAIRLYMRAVDLGQDKALISLGKVLASEDRFDEALNAFEQAKEREVKGAKLAWLEAHATGRLGPLADADPAWWQMIELAHDGDAGAQSTLLAVAYKRKARIPRDAEMVASQLVLAEQGDAKVAERLARYLRTRISDGSGDLELRTQLIEVPGVRASVRVEEQLHLAQQRKPSAFWDNAASILAATEKDNYPRALTVAARISKNAYVKILQRDLTTLGYEPGPATGFLNSRTIRATNAFCAHRDIQKACVFGPMKSVAIRAVSAELTKALDEAGHFDPAPTNG